MLFGFMQQYENSAMQFIYQIKYYHHTLASYTCQLSMIIILMVIIYWFRHVKNLLSLF